MGILSAIVQLLGGLALFLYGIELMGDGLKNSSGAALKRVLEKVTGNVVMGVLTGALVTAVIQSSTATIVLTVALIGAGVLNLKQAVSIVMGANIGTTVTAQIIRLGSIQSDGSWLLWLFDTDTLAPIALIIGIVLLMFIKSKRSNTIGDICIGFGILFVGLNLMTSGVEPLVGTDAFIAFVRFLNNPLFGILFGLVLTVIVQSSSATVGMLQTVASVPGAGITFAMAYPVIMGINLGTCVTTAMLHRLVQGRQADGRRPHRVQYHRNDSVPASDDCSAEAVCVLGGILGAQCGQRKYCEFPDDFQSGHCRCAGSLCGSAGEAVHGHRQG